MKKRIKRKSINQSRFSVKPIKGLLEVGTLESMKNAKRMTDEHLKFHWDFFAELAQQRSMISENISIVLNQTSISYSIKNWQRAVKYKYGLHPLCTTGSLTYIGGRFNTGQKVNTEVPSFPALYLSQDKDTALQEHLGQQAVVGDIGLTPREFALTNPASETIVSVSGQLDKVFDLTSEENLGGFVDLLKDFKISKGLIDRSRKLGIPQPVTIKTANLLLSTLLNPEWRQIPSNCDVPSNPQIFGHLVYMAGIEGILYPSKFTGKLCLAVFPRNFVGTDSFIMLDHEVPHEKVPARIDASNWRLCEIDAKEIIG
jgi:hypothetical protein